jgi:hypothetical protein
VRRCLAGALFLIACSPTSWEPVVGAERQVVPSGLLPDSLVVQDSNNNVSITLFEDRLFMGWRTAPSHFASEETAIHLVSSPDLGRTWDHEATFELGADLREPLLFEVNGTLRFSFFEAGTDALAFEPHTIWRTERRGQADWAEPEAWGEEGEVAWEVKVAGGEAFLTSYIGPHYDFDEEVELDVRFQSSVDGLAWAPVAQEASVYRGGASEAAFEFDDDGTLWAVLRNEDGDASGFGSLLCSAPAQALGQWDCPEVSDPERYDSPRMFRHEGELYLVARRDVGGPYDQGIEGMSLPDARWENLTAYSGRAKRTALYRIDREAREVVHIVDLPSAGDTAFPSVVQLDAHRFLVANYTSPVWDADRTWMEGQLSEDGTLIYLLEIAFEPER